MDHLRLILVPVSKSADQVKFETELLSNAKMQTEGISKASDKSFSDELYSLMSLIDLDLITRARDVKLIRKTEKSVKCIRFSLKCIIILVDKESIFVEAQ